MTLSIVKRAVMLALSFASPCLCLGSSAQSPAWTAESNQANSSFALSVSRAGDVNGDSYSDVVVGAPLFDNGQADEGRAFVYFGSASGLSAAAGWTAESDQAGAFFGGSCTSAGDVNGDGYGDVIVGASDFANGQVDEGRAFVYLGSASGLSAVPAWTSESDQASAYFGHSVSGAGDVNGDGYDDVIVGANGFSNGEVSEGRTFVYFGSASGLSAVPAWTAEGNQAVSLFGHSVSGAGDVNGDGFDDVVVGAPGFANGQTSEGRAFLYQGSIGGLSASPAWSVESDQANAFLGWSVAAAGDVNGDGYGDVIVGAYFYSNGESFEGRALVYLGSPTGLSMTPAWTTESDQVNASFGRAVSTAADVDGDGYSDVIVGADRFDNAQTDEGRVYIYRGSASGLSTSPAWTSESDQAGAIFGYSTSTAGDVNGDGYGDVIVGALGFDNGEVNEGRAFVFHGDCGYIATSTTFLGDGINLDTITPVSVVIGSSWTAPLLIGHAHGAGGSLLLKIRSSTVNGSNFASPLGGRLTEVLIAGPLQATLSGTHNGFTGGIAPVLIPSSPALLGLPWAAQYTVVGGGFADFSQSVSGIVGCQ